MGVCPRCSVEGDKTPKPLRYCPFCGGYFCEVHAKPRLVMSFHAYQSYVTTYKDIANVLREHWQSADGHPCPAYTRHFWQEYERRKREEQVIPPLPARQARVERVERSSSQRWDQAVAREQTLRAPRGKRGSSSERAGLVSRALAAVGFMVLTAAFSMPWAQTKVPFVQKWTLADMYAAIYSSSSPVLIDLRFPVSSVTLTMSLLLYPLAVLLAFFLLLKGGRSTLPGWLASAAALLWYIGIEALKAELARALSAGNPLIDPIIRILVFQTMSVDYGVTVASIGGIVLVVAGWLRS